MQLRHADHQETSTDGHGKIVVAVDGSPYSFGGLMTGLALGKAFNVPVEVISAFDPYFHYAAFTASPAC